ncbi:hypothetical protein [Desertivibrio insolitus]|uniref:hypothetical protein n=1 Tax=Herbiconiux sp. SYSU D00978 TaxID=2812562 RepID=UPI001A96A72B|nr:hypothetical protein [Herbiconiux sp. SYSU D00978]
MSDKTPNDNELTEHDTSYSPSSEGEMANAQRDDPARAVRDDPDVDPDDVKVAPGTGDYTDDGAVEIDPKDIHGIPQFDK